MQSLRIGVPRPQVVYPMLMRAIQFGKLFRNDIHRQVRELEG